MRLFYTISIVILLMVGCKKEDPNTPPIALFTIAPVDGDTETIFTFDASACTDKVDEVSDLQVRWDFQTDGVWDVPFSTTKIISHQFIEGLN